jgi:MYXO-CTERM domain-containing protein
MKLRRFSTVVAAAVVATVTFGLAGAAPAHATLFSDPVRPVLECVAHNGDGTHTAVFGYNNPDDQPQTVPVGLQNFFTGLKPDSGQPTVFAPGRHVAAFTVVFRDLEATWNLNGRAAIATPLSPRCNNGPEVSEAGAPVVLALGMMAMSGGWLWRRRRHA